MRKVPIAFVLVDAAFVADAKWRALARRLPDADDFHSALGAWLVALAASRRNGSWLIDVREETGSRFVDELEFVGLLTPEGFREEPWKEWAGKDQAKVAAGKIRAASAIRSEHGSFLPAGQQPPAPHQQGSSFPSPPLPSIESQETGRTESAREDDAAVAYYDVMGHPPSGKALGWLSELATDNGEPALCMALRSTACDPPRTYLTRVQLALTTVVVGKPNGKAPSEAEWLASQAHQSRTSGDPMLLSDIRAALDARRAES